MILLLFLLSYYSNFSFILKLALVSFNVPQLIGKGLARSVFSAGASPYPTRCGLVEQIKCRYLQLNFELKLNVARRQANVAE